MISLVNGRSFTCYNAELNCRMSRFVMSYTNTDITQPFNLKGKWWLPHNPEHTVFGTLKFDPLGTFILQLEGWLDPKRVWHSSEFIHPPVVHGVTDKGECCTLFGCLENNIHHSFGLQTSQFSVNMALLGTHSGAKDTILCQSATISLTNLEAWLNHQPFISSNKKSSGKKKGRHSLTLNYNTPKAITYSIPSIQSTLKFESGYISSNSFFSQTIKHVDYVRLRPKTRHPLNWFIKQALHLRNLLSLFTSETCFYRKFKVQLGRQKIHDWNKMIPIEADLIIRQGHFHKVPQLYQHDIPFPHKMVHPDLSRILDIWFSERQQLKPALDLFFSAFDNRELGVEFRLLSLVQALEALHRRFHKGLYIPERKYSTYRNSMVNAIPASAPRDLRDALKSRLFYGNEYSLRKRLTLMGRQLNTDSKNLISNDFKSFIAMVVDTRNNLTHQNPDPCKQTMNSHEMIAASFSLRLFLFIYLLKHVGMTESIIVKVLKEHSQFSRPQIVSFD